MRHSRQHILQKLTKSGLGVKRMFVESICDDEDVRSIVERLGYFPWTLIYGVTVLAYLLTQLTRWVGYWRFVWSILQQILEENIRKVKLSTPDYRDMDPEQAMQDFKQRRENYISVYEPVDESDGPHITIINSKKFIGESSIFVSVYCIPWRAP
jgi:hypothetical protein